MSKLFLYPVFVRADVIRSSGLTRYCRGIVSLALPIMRAANQSDGGGQNAIVKVPSSSGCRSFSKAPHSHRVALTGQKQFVDIIEFGRVVLRRRLYWKAKPQFPPRCAGASLHFFGRNK